MRNKPLLLMQTGDAPRFIREKHANFEAMFLAAANFSPFSVQVLRVAKGEEPAGVTDYCGVVVTGSPAMVTDRDAWAEKSALWLRRAVEQNLPVLGVCYGHQLVAHAFGGHVDYHPGGLVLGTRELTLEPEAQAHPLFRGLPERFPVNLAHSQSVLEKPKEARLLGSCGHDKNHVLAYGDNALTVQFHPEFTHAIMTGYTERFPDKDGTGAERTPLETPEAKSVLQRFLNFAGQRQAQA